MLEWRDIVASDDADSTLADYYVPVFYDAIFAVAIMNHCFGYDWFDVMDKMAENEVWTNIVCSGPGILIGSHWSIAKTFVYWMMGDEYIPNTKIADVFPMEVN